MTEVLIELETPNRTVPASVIPASVIEIWYEDAVETGDIKPVTGFALSDKIFAHEEAGLIKVRRVHADD